MRHFTNFPVTSVSFSVPQSELWSILIVDWNVLRYGSNSQKGSTTARCSLSAVSRGSSALFKDLDQVLMGLEGPLHCFRKKAYPNCFSQASFSSVYLLLVPECLRTRVNRSRFCDISSACISVSASGRNGKASPLHFAVRQSW